MISYIIQATYVEIYISRVGDHVTFVYGNIVSQLMAAPMIFFFFEVSLKLLLIYIDHVPGNSNSSEIYLFNVALVFF